MTDRIAELIELRGIDRSATGSDDLEGAFSQSDLDPLSPISRTFERAALISKSALTVRRSPAFRAITNEIASGVEVDRNQGSSSIENFN